MILGSFKDHKFYSEEENDVFMDGEDVWIVDPISGTKRFIEGLPHYAVVCSHLNKGIVDFAVVYDPTDNNLYTANEDGSFLNGALLKSGEALKKIIFAPSYEWKSKDAIESLRSKLAQKYKIFPSQGSFAYNYCLVAENKFDGVISFTKDSFPEFAGLFMANQAGAIATNVNGEKNIHPDDRIFVCGKKEIYKDLFEETVKCNR